jgi:hypothetical protein
MGEHNQAYRGLVRELSDRIVDAWRGSTVLHFPEQGPTICRPFTAGTRCGHCAAAFTTAL